MSSRPPIFPALPPTAGRRRPRAGLALALAAALPAAGCRDRGRGEGPPAAAAPAAPAAALTPRAAADEVVAEVDGQPILAGCVATQMAATGVSARAALDDCIGFELLAQAAAARGYADRPEVAEAREVETVRATIDHQFVSRFARPEDIPDSETRAHWDQYKDLLYNVPELRSADYVRIEVDPALERGGAEDRAAQALADRIYQATRDLTDLTAARLQEIAVSVVDGHPVAASQKPFIFPLRGRAVEEFADAAFAIPAVGRVSPPTRTRWGWDVILLVQIFPRKSATYEQALPEIRAKLFELSRRRAFHEWTNRLMGGRPTIDERWLERLTHAGADDPLRGETP